MTEQTAKSRNITLKVGIVLLILGTLLWLSVLIFPLLPVSVGVKVVGGATTAIVAETLCWAGAFCVGKEVITRYKRYFNPRHWKKTTKAEEASE